MEPNNHTPRTSPLVAPSIENANNTKHSVRRGPGKKASKSGSGNRSQYLLTALGFVVILAVSFGFGLGLPPNPSLPLPYGWFSAVVGWWVRAQRWQVRVMWTGPCWWDSPILNTLVRFSALISVFVFMQGILRMLVSYSLIFSKDAQTAATSHITTQKTMLFFTQPDISVHLPVHHQDGP